MIIELRKREPKGWGAYLVAPRPAGGHEGFTVVKSEGDRITLRRDNPASPHETEYRIAQQEGHRLQLEQVV